MLSAAVRRDERSGVRKFEEKLGLSEETVVIDTATFSVGRDIRLYRLTVYRHCRYSLLDCVTLSVSNR